MYSQLADELTLHAAVAIAKWVYGVEFTKIETSTSSELLAIVPTEMALGSQFLQQIHQHSLDESGRGKQMTALRDV